MPRDFALDALRLLAAASVLFFFYGVQAHAERSYIKSGYPELGFARYGYLGADLFFMISGYVIARSIQACTISQFVIRRFIRLYPTLWLCVLMTLAVEHGVEVGHSDPGVLSILANMSMVPRWFHQRPIGVAYWPLAVELEFYVLVGTAVWLFGSRRLDVILCVWACASFLAAHYGRPFLLPCGTYYPYFCIGAAFYLLRRNEDSITLVPLVMASMALCLQQAIAEAAYVGAFYHAPVNPLICCLLVYIVAALVFMSYRVVVSERLALLAEVGGGITYPLCLLHVGVGLRVMAVCFAHVGRWCALCSTILTVLILAGVVYFCFDRPVRRRLRAHFGSGVTDRHIGATA